MMKPTLPLMQLIFVALQKQNVFVDANHKIILRGSQVEARLVGGLLRRELPEASASQNERWLKDNTIKKPSSSEPKIEKDKKKDSYPGVGKNEKDPSGREDVPKVEKQKPPDHDDKDKSDKKKNPVSPQTRTPIAPTYSPVSSPTRTPTDSRVSFPTKAPIAPTFSPESPPTRTPTISQTSAPMRITTAPAFSPTPTIKPVMALPTNLSSEELSVPTTGTTFNPTISGTKFPSVIEPSSETITSGPMMVQALESVLMTPSNSGSTQTIAPSADSTEAPTSPFSTLVSFESSSIASVETINIDENDDSSTEAPTFSISSTASEFQEVVSSNSPSDTAKPDSDQVKESGDYPTEVPILSSILGTISSPTILPTTKPSEIPMVPFLLKPTTSSSEFQEVASSNSPDDTARPDSDQSPQFEFDETQFIAGGRLQPIIFDMTVSKLTQIMNEEKLEAYFKDFIQDVLDMRSSRDWYPFHSKSIHNVTMEFLPIFVIEGDPKERSADLVVPVRLIINGLVFVHLNEQVNHPTTTGNGSAPLSTFNDSFAHSMLLYFTFWGVDSLLKILEDDGGLWNPVIDSVSVGGNQLISIDKDGNYLYKEISDDDNKSSARTLQLGVLTFIIVSGSAMLWCV